jgi:hypothetical protein
MIKQTVCPNCGGLLRVESHGWVCKKCKGFISLQDGKFYEYVEKPFVPPMTNADRIRAMSDEELEAFLIDVDLDKKGSPFITDWGKWLKEPAED